MKSNSRNLEQFIDQHRQAFDTADPDPGIWDTIDQALDRLTAENPLEQFILVNRPIFDPVNAPERVWSAIERELDMVSAGSSDPLETFIREHRNDFDVRTPDLGVWAAIERQIPGTKAKVVKASWQRNLLRIAAAVAFLISGISIGIWYAHSTGYAQPGMAMSEVSSEYAELEQYYQRDITAKQVQLTSLVSYQDEGLRNDLLQMDNVMNELRQDLANVPPGNREQVVRAMIENYKAKAAILERVLEHLKQQQPATTNSGNHEVEKI